MSNDYDFYVELPSAKWIAIEVSENDTIGDLRTKIFEKSDVSVDLNTFTIDDKEVSDNRDKIFKTRLAKDVKYSEMATFIKINKGNSSFPFDPILVVPF
jgi:hypothetical protein